MRSATRMDSALPRTTPNRVPDLTAVPSEALQVTWGEKHDPISGAEAIYHTHMNYLAAVQATNHTTCGVRPVKHPLPL